MVKSFKDAQMVELVDTQDLKSCSRKRSAGSIPALSTKPDAWLYQAFFTKAKVAQLVEHDLAKVGVASSNLVFRSKTQRSSGNGGAFVVYNPPCNLFLPFIYKIYIFIYNPDC